MRKNCAVHQHRLHLILRHRTNPAVGLIEKAGGTVDLINVDDRLTSIMVRKVMLNTLFTTSCGAYQKPTRKAILVLTEKNNLPATA